MRRNWLPALLCVVAMGGLLHGLTAGALWDPHELSVAELSRRIALNLLGGSSLSIPGADNSLPIRADLGRGELPFTSAALGFRVFGLSEWAGRLPLALWALAGLAALYASLNALWDRRAALYAVAILATTPLYFLQARTLLGDGVTLATFTIAWSCLSAAVLAPALEVRGRVAFAVVGAVGLYAGFWCRGPILSVAVPALAVGLAARLAPPRSRLARGLGWALLALGGAALALGLAALSLVEQTHDYSVLVGSALRAVDSSHESPTFDVGLGRFLHAAFPWSALAPLALALPLRGERETDDEPGEPGQGAALSALLGWSFALAAGAWLEPALGALVLPAASCFAVLIALALSSLEARPRALPLLALCCAALTVIIGLDLHTYPEKVLAGFGVAAATLPESLRDWSASLWRASSVGLAGALGLLLFEHEAEQSAPVFSRAEYRGVLEKLQQAYSGNLVFALLLLEAGLIGFLLLSAVSERLVHLEQLDSFGVLTRQLVAALAVATPLVTLVPLQAMALRDAARWLFRRRWLTRTECVLAVAAWVGLVGSIRFYPAALQQLAPKQVFERYRELGAGQPLGMLGEASKGARYQAGANAETLDSLGAAFDWLEMGGSSAPRRWLLVRASELAELNARFRERHRRNLPVLDARSSELVLASNRQLAGERDQSPLAGLVRSEPPVVQHPLRAVLGKKLEVLGFAILGADGAPRLRISPATPYRLVLYYRVLAPLSGRWKTFVHVDGLQRRFNADHIPLEGKYPLAYWREGDIIVDSTELLLEPNFTPGQYQLYFGFFAGERRLEVNEGPGADDRVAAGALEIE